MEQQESISINSGPESSFHLLHISAEKWGLVDSGRCCSLNIYAEMDLSGTKGVRMDRNMCHPDLFKEGFATPDEAVSSLHLLSDCLNCRTVSLRGLSFQGQFTSDDWWKQKYEGPFILSQSRTTLKGHFTFQMIPGVWWACLTCTAVWPLSLITSDPSPSFLQLGILMVFLYKHLILYTLSQALLSREFNL